MSLEHRLCVSLVPALVPCSCSEKKMDSLALNSFLLLTAYYSDPNYSKQHPTPPWSPSAAVLKKKKGEPKVHCSSKMEDLVTILLPPCSLTGSAKPSRLKPTAERGNSTTCCCVRNAERSFKCFWDKAFWPRVSV